MTEPSSFYDKPPQSYNDVYEYIIKCTTMSVLFKGIII